MPGNVLSAYNSAVKQRDKYPHPHGVYGLELGGGGEGVGREHSQKFILVLSFLARLALKKTNKQTKNKKQLVKAREFYYFLPPGSLYSLVCSLLLLA